MTQALLKNLFSLGNLVDIQPEWANIEKKVSFFSH